MDYKIGVITFIKNFNEFKILANLINVFYKLNININIAIMANYPSAPFTWCSPSTDKF